MENKFYRCTNCDLVSDELKVWINSHGEEYDGCKNCGEAWEEVYECSYCKEYKLKHEMYDNDECEDCHYKEEIN